MFFNVNDMTSYNKADTAVFIGHNECYDVSAQQIEKVVVDLINQGVTVFMSGGQGGFDRLSANCIYSLKNQYPHITNILVIPYLTFNVFDRDIFDEIIYPEGFEKYYFKAAIPARNRYMVDNAAFAVCYVNHDWGGAAKTYEYAKQKDLTIIDL